MAMLCHFHDNQDTLCSVESFRSSLSKLTVAASPIAAVPMTFLSLFFLQIGNTAHQKR